MKNANSIKNRPCRQNNLLPLAAQLKKGKAELVSLFAARQRDGELKLNYLFKKNEEFSSLTCKTVKQTSPSLVDLFPKIDYFEKEISTQFAVKFSDPSKLGLKMPEAG